MIKEPVMIKIAEIYNKRKLLGWERLPSGNPDFLYRGQALEVKGSDSDFNRALHQFSNYARRYSTLKVMFPVDFLYNSSRVFKFNLLYNSIHVLEDKTISLILVSEESEFYYLKEFIPSQLLNEISYKIANQKEGMPQILSHLKSYLLDALTKICKEKPDMIIHKSDVQL